MSRITLQKITIHLVLMGHSKEHILFAIEHYSIKKMVIFTSEALHDENTPFIEKLIENDIDVLEVVEIDPFKKDSLEEITQLILETHRKYSNIYKNCNFISALTGGTNIMAISMALFALIEGITCHYIINPENNQLIEINFLQRLNEVKNIPSMKKFILEV